MKENLGNCFICKKPVTQSEIETGDNSVVMMITPGEKNARSYVHLSHHGVQDEYDRQLGVKKPK